MTRPWMHHLGSIIDTLSELNESFEFTGGFSDCLRFSAREDVSSELVPTPSLFNVFTLYTPGFVSAFSLRWTSLESISTTCFMVGLWFALRWVQNRATLMKRINSSSGYSVNSGSTMSRSLSSSLSFHVCNIIYINQHIIHSKTKFSSKLGDSVY